MEILMTDKQNQLQQTCRNALERQSFNGFDYFNKILFIHRLWSLIEAQKMIIEESKLTPEKLQAAENRLLILQSAVQFIYKLFDEGMSAVNLNSHLSHLNLLLEAENRELRSERDKLLKLIEEWNK